MGRDRKSTAGGPRPWAAPFERLEQRIVLSSSLSIDSINAEWGDFRFLAGDGLPAVWNTYEAAVSGPAVRAEFELGGAIVHDDDGSDGWSADFNLSELEPDEALVVRAFSSSGASITATIPVRIDDLPAWLDLPTVAWNATHSWSQGYDFDIRYSLLDVGFSTPTDWQIAIPGTSDTLLDLGSLFTGLSLHLDIGLSSAPSAAASVTELTGRSELRALGIPLYSTSFDFGFSSLTRSISVESPELNLPLFERLVAGGSFGIDSSLSLAFDDMLVPTQVTGSLTQSIELEGGLSVESPPIPIPAFPAVFVQVGGGASLGVGADLTTTWTWSDSRGLEAANPSFDIHGDLRLAISGAAGVGTVGLNGRVGAEVSGGVEFGVEGLAWNPVAQRLDADAAPVSLDIAVLFFTDVSIGPVTVGLETDSYRWVIAEFDALGGHPSLPGPVGSLPERDVTVDRLSAFAIDSDSATFAVDYEDSNGGAPTVAQLWLNGVHAENISLQLVSGTPSDGRYSATLHGLAPGTYQYAFLFRSDDGLIAYSDVASLTLAEDSVSLTLDDISTVDPGQAFTVSGRLTLNGSPVANDQVAVYIDGQSPAVASTDHQGRFSYQAIAPALPGMYNVEVALNLLGRLFRATGILTVADPTTGLDLQLEVGTFPPTLAPGSRLELEVQAHNVGSVANRGKYKATLIGPSGDIVDTTQTSYFASVAPGSRSPVQKLHLDLDPTDTGAYTIRVELIAIGAEATPNDNTQTLGVFAGSAVDVDGYTFAQFDLQIGQTTPTVGGYAVRFDRFGGVSDPELTIYRNGSTIASAIEFSDDTATTQMFDGGAVVVQYVGWLGGGEIIVGIAAASTGTTVVASPGEQTVFRGEQARYFISHPHYDMQVARVLTGFLDGALISASDDWERPGVTLSVSTGSLQPGTYDFWGKTDAIDGPTFLQRLQLTVVARPDVAVGTLEASTTMPTIGEPVTISTSLTASTGTHRPTITATITGPNGYTREIGLDPGAISGTRPIDFHWSTTGLVPGAYHVTVTATIGNDGNASNNSRSITLNLQPLPTLVLTPDTLTDATEGTLRTFAVAVTAADSGLTRPEASVALDLTDPLGVTRTWNLVYHAPSGTYRVDVELLAIGSYTAAYRASEAGFTSASTTASGFDILDVAPETTIVSVTPTPDPSGEVPRGPVTVTWRATDPATAPNAFEYQYRLNGGTWSAWAAASSASFESLPDGKHQFEVRARDARGTVDQTPASTTFTIVHVPMPVASVTISGRPVSFATRETVDFGETYLDADGPMVRLTVRNTGDAGLGVSLAELIDGASGFLVSEPSREPTLAPGESYDIIVKIDTAALGSQSATLRITTSDANRPTVLIDLVGEVIERPNEAPLVSDVVAPSTVRADGDGSTFTVTATARDPDGVVDRVEVYLDANQNGQIDETETLLGTLSLLLDGATWTGQVASAPSGIQQLLIRAIDERGATTTQAVGVEFNRAPHATSLTVDPADPLVFDRAFTLSATVADPDGYASPSTVRFYVDDGDGLFDAQDDEFLGDGVLARRRGSNSTWTLTGNADAAWGTNVSFWAIAADALHEGTPTASSPVDATSAPVISEIVTPAETIYWDQDFVLSVEASDDGHIAQYAVYLESNGTTLIGPAMWTGGTIYLSAYESWGTGDVRLVVEVIDDRGVSTSARVTVHVDDEVNVAPTLTIGAIRLEQDGPEVTQVEWGQSALVEITVDDGNAFDGLPWIRLYADWNNDGIADDSSELLYETRAVQQTNQYTFSPASHWGVGTVTLLARAVDQDGASSELAYKAIDIVGPALEMALSVGWARFSPGAVVVIHEYFGRDAFRYASDEDWSFGPAFYNTGTAALKIESIDLSGGVITWPSGPLSSPVPIGPVIGGRPGQVTPTGGFAFSLGTVGVFDTAVTVTTDIPGAAPLTFTLRVEVLPAPPTIDTVSGFPTTTTPVSWATPLSITATTSVGGITDQATTLRLYHDVNRDGIGNYDDDVLLAEYTSTDGSFDFEWRVPTSFIDGSNRVILIASHSLAGDSDRSFFSFNVAPTFAGSVGGLTAGPASVRPNDPLTLTATGVEATGLTITDVLFFLDDGSGIYEHGVDTLLGPGIQDSADTWTWSGTASPAWSTTGEAVRQKFFAAAFDNGVRVSAPSEVEIEVLPANTLPTIASFFVAGSQTAAIGDTIKFKAHGVADPGPAGGVDRLLIHLDWNGNWMLDGEDVLLGRAEHVTGDIWRLITTLNASPGLGKHWILATPVDIDNAFGDTKAARLRVVNAAPTIDDVRVIGDATLGESIGIKPRGIVDADGTVDRVLVFRDSDENGRFDWTDELIGRDRDASDGWRVNFDIPLALNPGWHTYFVIARDDRNTWSEPAELAIRVADSPPWINRLTVTNDGKVLWGDTFTVRARGVFDATDSIERVQFFADIDENGVVSDADQLLGADRDGSDGWSWSGTTRSEWTTGRQWVIARAKDARGTFGDTTATSVKVIEPAPIISSAGARPIGSNDIQLWAWIAAYSAQSNAISGSGVESIEVVLDTRENGRPDGRDIVLYPTTNPNGPSASRGFGGLRNQFLLTFDGDSTLGTLLWEHTGGTRVFVRAESLTGVWSEYYEYWI